MVFTTDHKDVAKHSQHRGRVFGDNKVDVDFLGGFWGSGRAVQGHISGSTGADGAMMGAARAYHHTVTQYGVPRYGINHLRHPEVPISGGTGDTEV